MKKFVVMSLFLLLLLFLFSSSSFADVPTEINYQGVLKDSSGNLVTTTVPIPMRFVIYDGPGAGATNLWSETQSVTLEAGLYSVQLGSATTPIPPAIFDGNTLYLGVKVGADPEMEPRIPLITVPYAFRSKITDSLSPAALTQVATAAVTVPNPLIPIQEVQGIGIPLFAERSLFVWGKGTAILGTVSSLGADAYGVGGICIGAGDAVRGTNFGNGAGVAGSSAGGNAIVARSSAKDKSGVYAAHGGDSSNSGYGIFATSANGTAIYGGGYSAGGMFQASNGHGVLGRSLASGSAAVYGETVSGINNIAGVYGKSSGFAAPGVYGTNNTNGGVAVKGENDNGIGVHGVGEIGVKGTSDSGGIAVEAENTAGGDALFVKGKIRITSSGGTGIPTTPNIFPIGTVTMSGATRIVRVYNSCVTNNSIIFLTTQDSGFNYPLRAINKVAGQYFDIEADGPPLPNPNIAATIGYLIVN